jgi:hypothetical protein
MDKRPELCKKIELASFYFEDGAVSESIRLLEEALKDLKNIKKKREAFYAKLKKDIEDEGNG